MAHCLSVPMVGTLPLALVTGSPCPLSLPGLWLLPSHEPIARPHWNTGGSALLIINPSLCSPRGSWDGSMGALLSFHIPRSVFLWLLQ